MGDFTLHTHARHVAAVACTEEAEEIFTGWYPDSAVVDYCDPGILLGINIKSALSGRVVPRAVQRNHNVFYGGSSFEELMGIHDETIDKARQITSLGRQVKNLNQYPFGKDKVIDYSTIPGVMDRFEHIKKEVAKAIYQTLFGKEPQDIEFSSETIEDFQVMKMKTSFGVLYFDTSSLARAYAESKMAEKNEGMFSWYTPDHIVLCGMTDTYIRLNDPTDIKRIKEDVKKQIQGNLGSLYSRTYIVRGMGIVTVGGHYDMDPDHGLVARNAVHMAHDCLCVNINARAVGTPRLMTYRDARFIGVRWHVEKERLLEMGRG